MGATVRELHGKLRPPGRLPLVYALLGVVSLMSLVGGDWLQWQAARLPEAHQGTLDSVMEVGGGIVKEMGIAGLVAILLAITFERLSSAEFRKLAVEERDLAKQDVFYYVYGYAIPESIRDEINTQILQARFVREFLKLRYSLEPIVDSSGQRFMRVQLRTRYRVRNLTAHTQTYELNASLERAFRPDFEDDVKFLFVKIRGTPTPLDLREDELIQRTMMKQAEVTLNIANQIVVPPKGCVTIAVGYQTVNHYDGVGEYFTFRDHTCEVDVQVKVPADMDVTLCDFGGQALDDDIEHHPEVGIYRWTCPTPMLRNQGIYLTWMPKTTAKQRGQGSGAATTQTKQVAIDHLTRDPLTGPASAPALASVALGENGTGSSSPADE